MESVPSAVADGSFIIKQLEQARTDWLEQPNLDFSGRTPANIIDNERRRLPQAMSAAEIMIDEDCDLCRMSAMEAEMGFGPTFWHLDGCNMEDEFAFSHYRTVEEWEAEQRRWEEFNREFEQKQAERERRLAAGETVEDEFDRGEGG